MNFCTSGGSGIEKSTGNLKEILGNQVDFIEGKRMESSADTEEIRTWIGGLDLKGDF